MNLDVEKLDNLIKKDVSVFIENYDYILSLETEIEEIKYEKKNC